MCYRYALNKTNKCFDLPPGVNVWFVSPAVSRVVDNKQFPTCQLKAESDSTYIYIYMYNLLCLHWFVSWLYYFAYSEDYIHTGYKGYILIHPY